MVKVHPAKGSLVAVLRILLSQGEEVRRRSQISDQVVVCESKGSKGDAIAILFLDCQTGQCLNAGSAQVFPEVYLGF